MSLVSISGPSGAGKTTLINKIINEFGAKLLPSWTTRELRKGENENGLYRYISLYEYFYKCNNNFFLLSENVAKNYYGTSLVDIENAYRDREIWLVDFTAKSVLDLINHGFFPKASIILQVDKCTSELRMIYRGDEKSQIRLRLDRFEEEMHNCNKLHNLSRNTFFLNGEDSLDHLLQDVYNIFIETNICTK